MEEPTADLIRSQLRRMRSAAGLSQEEFGRLLHYSASMVSAVETGARPLDRVFLARADEALKTGDLLTTLLKMAERESQPSWFRPWLEAERSARQLRYFNPSLIPGLFQTANYARMVLRFDSTRPAEEVEKRVAGRLERQEILLRDHPPLVIAVTDESALRRRDAIMAEQLAHLLHMAELPHVNYTSFQPMPVITSAFPGRWRWPTRRKAAGWDTWRTSLTACSSMARMRWRRSWHGGKASAA